MKKYLLLIFSIVILAGSLSAQSQPQPMKQAQVDRFAITEKLNFARNQMGAGNYEGAAAMLESIYAVHPDDYQIVSLLKQCYESLGYMEKEEELIRRFLEIHPTNLTFQVFYADILSKQGRASESADNYRKAVTIADQPVRIEYVINSMIANNMSDSALVLIDEIRSDLNDPGLMRLQRSSILENQKKYRAASEELYPVLIDTLPSSVTAASRFTAMLGFIDSREIAENFLLEKLPLDSSDKPLTLLSNYYLRNNRLEDAYNITVRMDSLDNNKGNKLYNLMQNSFNRKHYALCVKIGEYIIANVPTASRFPMVHFTYADALTELGRYDEAIAKLNEIHEQFKGRRDRSDVLYKLGKIYLDGKEEYDKAVVYFDSVITLYGGTTPAYKAQVDIPHSYLRQGKLKPASVAFGAIIKDRLSDEMKEEIDYYLALIEFFNKSYDSCKTGLNKLLVDYPRGFYVNDALKLLNVFEDASENQQLLYDYSNAELFSYMKKNDSVFYYLEKIAANPSGLLNDLALYKLINLSFETADSSKAFGYIGKLESDYTESYYLPYALKMKADTFFERKENDEAVNIYRTLLSQYPNYPFTDEVRERLRSIEENSGSA